MPTPGEHKTVQAQINEELRMEARNRKLTELRDWLLPMLMNGQVTVKN
jgi:type I restriction enzyme S subunit